MSEMVERVAATLWITQVIQDATSRGRKPKSVEVLLAEWHKDVTDPDNGFYRPIYEDMVERAEAAILAMLEPTDAMEFQGAQPDGMSCGSDVAGNVWRAMIDEALK